MQIAIDQHPLQYDTPRVYVAGPMRGYPEHNIPAFEQCAATLRAKGLDVVTPVEVGVAWAGGEGDHRPEEYLRRDLLVMLHTPCCNGIALLPGWEASTGARLEAAVALVLGYQFFNEHGERIAPPASITHTKGYGP